MDEYASWFSYGGMQYPLLQTTYSTIDQERISVTAAHAAKTSGPVFALVLARMQVFSQIRFASTRMQGSQPGDLFGTAELKPLEQPWPGGVTADLLARMEWDASAAGQAYIRRKGPNLHRLNPSWVIIVMGSAEDATNPQMAADTTVDGYLWVPPGGKPSFFQPSPITRLCRTRTRISWACPGSRRCCGSCRATRRPLSTSGGSSRTAPRRTWRSSSTRRSRSTRCAPSRSCSRRSTEASRTRSRPCTWAAALTR